MIREHLIAAASEEVHPRDWRPQLLAFSNDAHRRAQLLLFASWLEGGSGLTTAVKILEGEGAKMMKLKTEAEAELRTHIKELNQHAFPLVVTAPDFDAAIHILLQSFGIGPIRANTILLNWLDELPKGILGLKELRFGRNLRATFRLGFNIIILKTGDAGWALEEEKEAQERRIDVWWWDDATSRLMLLLAYLLTRNEEWEDVRIRVLASSDLPGEEGTPEALQKTLEDVRITAEPKTVEDISAETIVKHSAEASLVFLPFRITGKRVVDSFGEPLEELLSRLPAVAMVLAAEDIELDAEPDEGKAGETAKALDTFYEAQKRAQEAQKTAAKAAGEAEEKLEAMASAVSEGADEQLMSKVKAAIEAKEQATSAARKAAKFLAKVQDAAQEAERLGIEITPDEPASEEKCSLEDNSQDQT